MNWIKAFIIASATLAATGGAILLLSFMLSTLATFIGPTAIVLIVIVALATCLVRVTMD